VDLGYWEVQWNSQGVLRFVFVPPPSNTASKLTSAQAGARVAQILTALGLTLPVPDLLAYDVNVPEWTAEWPRKIDGVPAFQDGTAVSVTPDGEFISYRYTESATAPKPAHLLTEAQAKAKYPSCKNSSNGAGGKTETCTATLVWYRPGLASPDEPLRLCWVVKYSWSDGDQGSGGGAVYVDAGTGEVIDSAATS